MVGVMRIYFFLTAVFVRNVVLAQVSELLTDNFLLVTDYKGKTIYQVSLVNEDIKAIDTNTYGNPIAIAYNYVTQEIFWSTKEFIHRLSLKGHNYNELFSTEILGCYADRIAIDYPNGNIYYTAVPTSLTGFVGVGVISPKGFHKRLISFGSKPRDIGLDSEEGIIFWTDHGSVPAFLAKANMDGTGTSYVIRDGLGWPNGLAIDLQAKILYVTDGKTDIIYKCSYFGVCTNHYTDPGSHLMDIAMLGNYLYYTAWKKQYISKLLKANPVGVIKVGDMPEFGRLDSLALYSSLINQSLTTTTTTTSTTTTKTDSPTATTTTTDSTTTTTTDSTTTTTTDSTTITTTDSMTTITTTTTTDKSFAILTSVVAGSVVGFLVLGIVIIVIVCVIVKRSNNSKNNNNGQQDMALNTLDFDIAFLTTPAQNTSRPDSTYDIITFDIPGERKTDKSRHDMELNKKYNECYEKLNFKKNELTINNLRPSAVQNVYQGKPSK